MTFQKLYFCLKKLKDLKKTQGFFKKTQVIFPKTQFSGKFICCLCRISAQKNAWSRRPWDFMRILFCIESSTFETVPIDLPWIYGSWRTKLKNLHLCQTFTSIKTSWRRQGGRYISIIMSRNVKKGRILLLQGRGSTLP